MAIVNISFSAFPLARARNKYYNGHMRIIYILLSLCVTLCLTGCFTVDSANVRKTGEEHLFVSNYGWYLFNAIPIACGNAAPDRLTPIVVFRDDVTMDKVQRRFMAYTKSVNRTATDLAYHNDESVMFEVPGLSFPLPIPYILTYREVQLSGVLQ